MRPFLLTLHIAGVILAFGPTMASPIFGAVSMGGPEAARTVTTIMHKIERGMIIPLSTLLVPGAGLGLIITQHWEPFGEHRWLLTAVILYVVGYLIGMIGHGGDLKKMIALLDAGKHGSAEWVAIGKREQMLGMMSFLIFFAILTLMVWKPDM